MNARRQAIKELNDNGYTLVRNGAKHDIYYSEETKYTIPLRHDFDDEDLKVIRREIKKGGR
ncbi:MAG: hypothetical protein J6N53_08885 [Lachnospiraceae bacterium]|nr:hypothetical protein [Lachnospiraceae bacterium]MBO6298950.1 hypothetical protein [Lachnospiraceae bacterium]MBP3297664.1 hypothetical protein [Lachnospiraceae bacterium]